MKNDVSHKKDILNFNENDWAVDNPVQRMKNFHHNQQVNSPYNSVGTIPVYNQNHSASQFNSNGAKDNKAVLIVVIASLIVIAFVIFAIIFSRVNLALHIGSGQAMSYSFYENYISAFLGNYCVS